MIRLITFQKPKYAQQIIAVDNGPNQLNLALFDATKLFADEDTFVAHKAVLGQAEEFAKAFVAQMNAVPDLIFQIGDKVERCDRPDGSPPAYRFRGTVCGWYDGGFVVSLDSDPGCKQIFPGYMLRKQAHG